MIDTEVESGDHVTFVLIAPNGQPDTAYVGTVNRARAALRETALSAGYRFSTVGVAHHWQTDEGLAILQQFGPFDELVLGRNWFNSGLARYVTDLDGIVAFPQVVVTFETIDVGSNWWTSSGAIEFGRYIGARQLEAWEAQGFVLPDERSLRRSAGSAGSHQ